jgi:ppGpp synthetase/RelA/SpoT-type nucleotidyltranferase
MEALDLHCELIMDEYREALPTLEAMQKEVLAMLREALDRNGLVVTTIESRIKTPESLAGKLALKGAKYTSLSDITDVLGARIVTYYTDDVDRLAAIAEQLFEIDWSNSVDKRLLHQLDSFGYNSLHYICRLPNYPYRFELQLRTTLQHAWAAINHDTGYKTGVEIPREYLRRMNRLAGLLEMADDEFSRIRTEITDYRRRVQQLVQNGKLDDVLLDGDTFRSYMQIKPLDALNRRIAAINQAEILEAPLIRYLRVLKDLGCNTLGDVSRLIKQYEDDAYRLARHQLGNTDLDIISSSIGLQNICIVCILSNGWGKKGLVQLFDVLNGHNSQNEELAEITYEQAKSLQL